MTFGVKKAWAALAMAFGVLIGTWLLPAVDADAASASPGGAIVALAYDVATQSLLKSEGGGLYRSRDGGETWTSLPLPVSNS